MNYKEIIKSIIKEIFSFIKLFLIAVIIIIPVKYFIVEPFLVQGASMSPNYETGHYLIVNKLKENFSEIKRGNVLVFVPPSERSDSLLKYSVYFDPRVKYIKRVIGLPEEIIKLEDGKIFIKKVNSDNYEQLEEPYIYNKGIVKNQIIKLARDEYYMLGDNRPNSKDSRVFGAIKKDDIIGEPVARLLPFNKIGFYPEIHKF